MRMVHIAVPEALLTLLAVLGYALLGAVAIVIAPACICFYVYFLVLKALYSLAGRGLGYVKRIRKVHHSSP